MIQSPSLSKRQLVPRWRSLSRTITSCELSWPADKRAVIEQRTVPTEVVTRLEQWRRAPSVVSATELVEAAIVHAHETEAVNAARFLAQERSCAVPLVRKHAALVLQRTGHEHDIPSDIVFGPQDTAALWRTRTRLHPHDALAWVELALAQVSRGHDDHALRSITVALKLAPKNRHVLRSTARLHVHMNEPDRAYDLIRKNPATPYDPWLLAAEIALAPGAERKSVFFKKGIAMLEEDRRRPRQITELAGALGSTLLEDGNLKRGRRLFQQSMTDPTGNSLAQAEWASGHYRERLVGQAKIQASSDAREAMALHLFRIGNFVRSLDFARQWINEEPYSIRAHLAATVAANLLDDYAAAKELACAGLRYQPMSAELLTNLVFSLACRGQVDEAEARLRTIESDSEIVALICEADRGLIALRRGETSKGEAHYQKAISGFRRQEHTQLERLAHAYFAREAVRASLPIARKLLDEADKWKTDASMPEVNRVLNTARAMVNDMTMLQDSAG